MGGYPLLYSGWGVAADERLRLGEGTHAFRAQLAADPRSTEATERQPRVLRRHAVTVDADGAGNERPRDAIGERVVPGPHRGRETERSVVRREHGRVYVVVGKDR